MTTPVDLTGNTLFVDDIEITDGTTISDIVATNMPTFNSTVDAPGDDAGTPAAFDKVLKITVGSTDYWVGLYDNNTTA